MISPDRRLLGGILLGIALFPGSARAQTFTHSLADLQRTLRVGQSVVVTDDGGQKTKARVEKLSTSSITVGARTFTEATIREVRLTDSLWHGALIGAAIGAGLATWDYFIDPSEPGNAAIFTVAIGLGTAIGAGIDALQGGKLLYASPKQRAGVTVLPLLERSRQGALVSLGF